MITNSLDAEPKARTGPTTAFGRIRQSLGTRGGLIEWGGGILALPFGAAAIWLGAAAARSGDIVSIQASHYLSGCFFAVGMALGIYASAWAFVAEEPHTRLAAHSAVLDAAACIVLAIAIEWYFRAGTPKGYLPVPFAIPALLWAAGTLMLIVAMRDRKRVTTENEEEP